MCKVRNVKSFIKEETLINSKDVKITLITLNNLLKMPGAAGVILDKPEKMKISNADLIDLFNWLGVHNSAFKEYEKIIDDLKLSFIKEVLIRISRGDIKWM